jgi:predicted Ser/Thr protein kinase
MPAWTDTADKEMLLNFITVTAPTVSKGTNQTVADMMGEGYTSESVRYVPFDPYPLSDSIRH